MRQVLLAIAFFMTAQTWAADRDDAGGLAQLGYQFDLRLVYIDSFLNPQSAALIQSESSDTEEEGSKTRTLGLSRARLGVYWLLPGQSRLDVVFRPDADSLESEHDSRSGDVYKEKPKLHLLDAYQLSVLFQQQFRFAAGVWESMVHDYYAYDTPLEFGLNVQLPQRFAGAKVRWQSYGFQPDRAQPNAPSGFEFGLWAFTGDRDRAEARRESDETFDRAPSSQDSHYGIALQVGRVDGLINQADLTIGMSREDVGIVDDATSESHTLQESELFLQLGNQLNIATDVFATALAADIRLSQEQYNEGDDLPNRLKQSTRWHQSFALTARTELGWNNHLLYGAHVGRSQLSEGILAYGYQLDLGYDHELTDGLWLTTLVADEHRDVDDSAIGKAEGAFQNDDENRSTNRRYAIELRYIFDQG